MTTLKLLLAVLMCWLVARPGQFSNEQEVQAVMEAHNPERKR